MTDLSKLTVSLTKHGAHKISRLLRLYGSDEILNHLDGSVPGVNIELAQAKKNLSVYRGKTVPNVWNKVRSKGNDAINGLVLISIIFSHHKLIQAMQGSSNNTQYIGTITRGNQLEGKAYTNFSHTLEELGFATKHETTEVSYNLKALFSIEGFSDLVKELLQLKLKKAKWDGNGSIVDEMVSLDFHEVFSIESKVFIEWLTSNLVVKSSEPIEKESTISNGAFSFTSGHSKRKTGTTERSLSNNNGEVNLKHNEIQNELHTQLASKYGSQYVGTEILTGEGTFIDLVVKTNNFCYFYEIKTASSVKSCIREAIPQLLEYAYWKKLDFGVDKLIIVSELEITTEAEKYLEFLRSNFRLKLYYYQFVAMSI